MKLFVVSLIAPTCLLKLICDPDISFSLNRNLEKKLKPNRRFQLQQGLETGQRHTNNKIEPNRYNKREKKGDGQSQM